MAKAWIVTTNSTISSVVELVSSFEETEIIVVGSADVPTTGSLTRIPLADGVPSEAAAPAVASAIGASGTDVVVLPNRATERVLAGAIAAKLNAPILTGVQDIEPGRATVTKYGGVTQESLEFFSPVVIVTDGGAPVEGEAVQASDAIGDFYPASVTNESMAEGDVVNLSAAKRVVGVGRGIAEKDDLALINDFASAIGAAVGCTRPISEGHGWMPRETYIGISGQHISPDVYVAIGLSGQIHHTAGIDDSKTIVVINDDEDAAIFKMADYGIVGDLYQVLPELRDALK